MTQLICRDSQDSKKIYKYICEENTFAPTVAHTIYLYANVR